MPSPPPPGQAQDAKPERKCTRPQLSEWAAAAGGRGPLALAGDWAAKTEKYNVGKSCPQATNQIFCWDGEGNVDWVGSHETWTLFSDDGSCKCRMSDTCGRDSSSSTIWTGVWSVNEQGLIECWVFKDGGHDNQYDERKAETGDEVELSEAIAAAIEKKCFARLRDILTRWEAMFHKLFPDETWTGPKPEQLSMARLAGGGALQSDTCNGARKAKRVLAEMIAQQAREVLGEEEWAKLTEEEQSQVTRVHELDCWQHLRNIFLKEMSSSQAKHVAEELKPHLDAFSSWDRMTTDYTQLLRASYKELHHGNKYYKGKGQEFWDWLEKTHPKIFAIHFERAEGGRQDLDYDAAVPLYVMRPYIIEFLHTLVFGADHSNVLEDFLYSSFRSQQYIAMTRANAIIDLAVSRPLRWLAGNSYKLPGWSPLSMGRALDMVEKVFVDHGLLQAPSKRQKSRD